ncbi:16S rRNA (cytosine(1402)-N(4))-methyltransferase RsmH [Prochlorothrix hollandica]|uniref:16S rRNA (cytosine(1402)-N(4))-methyltransferase RsmH n=1 Tax=Prochlorothrix hollandica TaxID=1223 RepID=UPI00333FBA43
MEKSKAWGAKAKTCIPTLNSLDPSGRDSATSLPPQPCNLPPLPPCPVTYHVPVLTAALLEYLAPTAQGLYLDATVGGGGHSQLLLEADPQGHLWAIDQDREALAAAQERLAGYGDRVQFWQGNFADFEPGDRRFDGIVADLGVSSAQLDRPERGFSFRHTAPLDMRMNSQQALTAAEIINHWSEKDLADIFYTYGEERLSRRIAREIVAQRPLHTTTDLAEVISRSVPKKYRYGRIHPATRVFQGLRIAVNGELTVLDTLLAKAPLWLAPGGRLALISFHSLEDRRVKQAFKASPLLDILTKKPLIADDAEIQANPRSRSAKLRVAQRRRDQG